MRFNVFDSLLRRRQNIAEVHTQDGAGFRRIVYELIFEFLPSARCALWYIQAWYIELVRSVN